MKIEGRNTIPKTPGKYIKGDKVYFNSRMNPGRPIQGVYDHTERGRIYAYWENLPGLINVPEELVHHEGL